MKPFKKSYNSHLVYLFALSQTADVQQKRKISAETRREIAEQKTILKSVDHNIRCREKEEELDRVQAELKKLCEETGGVEAPAFTTFK